MKKTYSLLVIPSLFAFFACNDHAHKTSETDTVVITDSIPVQPMPVQNIMPGIEGCYMQVLARDTFAASLQQNGNSITGKLSFDNFEKDGSSGNLKGEREDNIIKLLYSFVSEGTKSVMEVYFKYDNGKLIRGTGDMNNKGDTAYFTDPSTIKYNGGMLQKLPCSTLPGKYK